MTQILRKTLTVLAVAFFMCTTTHAQIISEKNKDAVVYIIKVEELNDDYKAVKISTMLNKYSDRIIEYTINTLNKTVALSISEKENILNILEVFSINGYTAWYNDNENNRVINTGKGFTEKFPEKQ
ncbi:MAG: hypothetical protein IPJ79_03930 [Bacteroidetes bacterium]|nr:hypothetical protein [Bacteroidota bacterium]